MKIEEYSPDFLDALLSDELEQFKGDDESASQVMTEVLAGILQDVSDALIDLNRLRSLDSAEGAQLDGIGDIVKLTRAQAGMLSHEVTTDFASIDESVLAGVTTPTELLERHAQYGIIPFDVLDDDRYREYLRYKIFLNTNHCTYPDLMKVVRMFWTHSPVTYSEDVNLDDGVEYHATILLDAGELRPEQNARLFFLVPIIKAAGVMLLRRAETRADMEPLTLRANGVICGTVMRTRLPYMANSMPLHARPHTIVRSGDRPRTTLPEMEDT